ncbi:MAG TPA: TauD/TfdA family dioxygenase [Xanthobacteraceae bacterium]|nr:TauD/TfdA family dioxygenase [Xanthobacteraceae bacterium]
MTLVADKPSTISVVKLHPVIGAEVRGVDLSRPFDADTLRLVKNAWYDHTVLVFRDQKLSEDDQRRFASYFGPVAKRVPPRPGAVGADSLIEWDDMLLVTDNVDAGGKPLGALGHGEMWFHSDKCYHRKPHRASFLYGIEIPTEGGHTRFSSSYAAYERLSADAQKKIDGAMVMQGHQYTTGRRIDFTVDIETMHHCRQPIIVTNPGSGRKALYVTSQNTMWIEGMDRAESEALLTTMFDIAEDPAIIYEHVWRVGDLVVWDNLACLHARTDWPSEQRRTLRRCTTEGEALY